MISEAPVTNISQVTGPSVHQMAINAGLIVLHVKRKVGGDSERESQSIEVPVYVPASAVVGVEPSLRHDGTETGAIVDVSGSSRRYVVESAEAVVRLLARMRDREASRGE